MYFHKIPHPANFAFVASAELPSGDAATSGELAGPHRGDSLRLTVNPLGRDVFRVAIDGGTWRDHGSQADLAAALPGPSAHRVEFQADGALYVREAATGRTLLHGVPHAMFGTCGATWLFQFRHEAAMQFYGLGEHSKNLEKSGQRVKFWNTDLFGDFAHCEINQGYANPMYVAVPWVVVKQGNEYVGILVHNPGAVFMDLASNFVWSAANSEDRERRSFYLGAPDGRPELYVIVGPSLPELLRKFQALVGHTPLPPLWALGHHQCRWGYASPRDLATLDAGYREHGVPCDGLWLDIDYMDRYKVFTFAPDHWRDEAEVRRTLAKLARRGRRVVPILDPGVKAEPGYEVCDDGLRAKVFCLNPAGKPYVGFVWPGKTYLPDFSLAEARDWWTARVRSLAALGVAGAWIDMNDPSVGAVELDDMLFERGTRPHAIYHNQYALGMAQATRAGFLEARPEERPFLLSRSAYLSSSRHTAVWTGDNVANWHHLRLSIPISLGLSMSGLPFNGPDVCGFMGDTTPALAVAWYKAGFLFPFVRNHSGWDTRPQEPWALGLAAARTIAHYIRLRYKLLPYLYQLFVAQEETGDTILRPLFHDFADTPELPLGSISDEFLVGPAILQAPVVEEERNERLVVLPGAGAARWFSGQDGHWFDGGKTFFAKVGAPETPLFLREGAIVPMQPGERTDNRNDLATVELHCFLRADTKGTFSLRYVADDGASFAYRHGVRSSFTVEVSVGADGELRAEFVDVSIGWHPLRVRFVVYDAITAVHARGAGISNPAAGARGTTLKKLKLTPHRWRFTGQPLSAKVSTWLTLKAAVRRGSGFEARDGSAPANEATPPSRSTSPERLRTV